MTKSPSNPAPTGDKTPTDPAMTHSAVQPLPASPRVPGAATPQLRLPVPPRNVPSGPPVRRRRRLAIRVGGLLAAILVLLGVVVATVPVPFVEGYLTRTATSMIAAQVAVPGAAPPQITIRGLLLPQLLSRRLTEIQLTLPDLDAGGARHARVEAVLHGLTQTGTDTSHADQFDASITLPFSGLPSKPGQPKSTFSRGQDGSLVVTVPDPGPVKVTTRVLVKLTVDGEKVRAEPQGMILFGQLLPPEKVVQMTGGARTQALPHLPTGLAYRSITAAPDGLHVALGGVVTTPLSTLPTQVGGRTVSYVAENGLLGIATAIEVPPIINVPLTIFVRPQLGPGALTLVPQIVRLLGRDRPPGDLLAGLVLSQLNQKDLARPLPALPPGVAYRSVTVDGQGVKVEVGGATVRPFSVVSGGPPGGTFGASNGLLTATYHAPPASAGPLPIVMFARPVIAGAELRIEPHQFLVLKTMFPAPVVLHEVTLPVTRYPLQALPAHLNYTGVEVLPDGLRIRISGKDVTLTKGLFAPAGKPGSAPR